MTIPFAQRGRTREGLDCWGGFRLVNLEQFHISLPNYGGYRDADDAGGVQAVLKDEQGSWRNIDGPRQVGDAALFRIKGDRLHIGMAVSATRMLHWLEGVGASVEEWASPVWAPRLIGWHRYGVFPTTVRLNPLAPPSHITIEEGSSVAEVAERAGLAGVAGVCAMLGGVEVPRSSWGNVRPRAGRVLEFAVVPEGGGGGGKTALRIVLTIAVIVASFYVPGAFGLVTAAGTPTLAGVAASATVSLAGTLAINALVPLPGPRITDNSAGRSSPSIAGSRNSANPWGPFPVPFGTVRIAPPYGALPYTEIVGDDQYVRCLFTMVGPVDLSDLRIGTTSIDDLEDVEVEIRSGYPGDAPLRLFPGAVHEAGLSVLLSAAASWQIRTTQVNTDEIGVDVTFPQGVAHINADGTKSNLTVALEVEYSVAGAGVWVAINVDAPEVIRQLDVLFRSPEAAFGGTSFIGGGVEWGAGFAGTKPVYLPTTGYSWKAEGWIEIPAPGTYHFGVDGSDAIDLTVDDTVVVSWYGVHNPVGGNAAPPDYTVHNGSIVLTQGWHRIVVRMESRSGNNGAVALGWKKPGDVAYATIPGASLFLSAGFLNQLKTTWYSTASFSSAIGITESRTEPIRRNKTWAVPRGQYDVRIRRTTADTPSDRDVDDVYWTALRSIKNTDPLPKAGVAKIALRIRATDQLNGTVDSFNCLATSVLPDWDSAAGAWVVRGTSSQAAHYRAVLQGVGIARPVADDRIDLPALQAMAENAETLGLEFNGIVDFTGTVYERLRDICATARATYTNRNGKHSVVVDVPQTVPCQHFTPRNTRGFTGRKSFPDPPHGLLVRFMNSDEDYTQTERIVLDDGYQIDGLDAFGDAAPGLPAATKFETIELFGVATGDEVWKHGRYHLAVLRLRPETFEFDVDVEQLVSTRGDMVLVTNDVPLIGLNSGRVVALNTDPGSGDLIGVTVDEEITMAGGPAYAVRFRKADNTSVYAPVLPVAGIGNDLIFITPITLGDPAPEVGDLFVFGEAGTETREMMIKSISAAPDLAARIVVIDHAPAVHDADTGTIPPYNPGITIPPYYNAGPEAPVVDYVQSDDFVMVRGADGSLEVRMLIVLRPQSGTRELGNLIQVRVRPTGTTGPWVAYPNGQAETCRYSVGNVITGVEYDVKVRYVAASGRASDWTFFTHTIAGKGAPPPDVVSLVVDRLGDGTRRYTFDLGTIPPDVAGVVIRYGPGGTGAWGDLTPLHDGLLEASSPQEMNAPPAGYWRFGIKMVDTSNNESVNAVFVDKLLGPPRMDGVAVSEDARAASWPGTQTGCFESNDHSLEARSTNTWATLPATWAAWSRWNLNPVSPIVYTHTTIDAGFLFHFNPSAYYEADGSALVETRWSEDGVTWSAWTDVDDLADVTVYGRYAGFRITVTATGGSPVPRIAQFGMFLRAPSVTQEIPDLDTSTVPGSRRYGVGDFRLPIAAGQFSVVRSISIGFNGTGAGWTWEFVDKDAVNGPRIRLYDSTDALADTTIDAVIRGL